MLNPSRISRRGILQSGIACAASAVLGNTPAHATNMRPKGQFETKKVIYLGGDMWHNGYGQEYDLRATFERTDWSIIYSQDARFVTPELISDADLVIITRWGAPIPAGWSPNPLVESRPQSDGYPSDEFIDALTDNVINRGMGFIALHCTIASYLTPKYMDLMGIECIMHGPVQTVHLHNFNQNHPVTEGIEDFDLSVDENFGVKFINKDAVPLYETTGEQDKRHDIAGWSLAQGKGRVVGLAAGHNRFAWVHPIYRQLHWRAAHWAMNEEIPSWTPPDQKN